jgi:sialidase-1
VRLLALIACASLSFADSASLGDRLGGVRGFAVGAVTTEYPRSGEGSTIRLKDGRLLHAFSRHHAGDDRNPDMWPGSIVSTYSRDNGATWSELELTFQNPSGRTAMQPSFARMPNGTLGVTYSLIENLSTARKVFRSSTDEGRTWSPEFVISPTNGYWTGAHDRMLVLSTGRVLYPLHTKLTVQPETLATRVAYSDDSGQTWKLSATTLTVKQILPASEAQRRGRSGLHEASIAERGDGSLLLIGRTYAGVLYQSTSTDQGVTWTEPKPTTLPSGAAPGRLQRIPGTNDLLVIWNSCCVDKDDGVHGHRLTLSSAISTDGGTTWKWQRDLADITPGTKDLPHWVDYPAIYIDGANAYLSYRLVVGKGLPTLMEQRAVTLPVSWFYARRDFERSAAEAKATLFTQSDLARAFAELPQKPPTNREILTTPHLGFKVARVENRDGPREVQSVEDRVFYVTAGSATLRVEDSRDLEMHAGSTLIVPRGVPYQIKATGSKVEFLVIRIQ